MKNYLRSKSLPLAVVLLLSAWQSFAQAPCCNILTNGDFELGGTEFTSGLPLNCACAASSYCIGNNFQVKCSGWPNLADHTSGGGKFLLVDGSSSGPVDIWQYATQINANTSYCFCFWVANVYSNTFDLALTVGGVQVPGAVFTVQGGAAWSQYCFNFSGVSGNSIAIRQVTGGGFRDFGLDDIEFGAPITPNFGFSPDATCGMNLSFFNQSTGPAPLTYQWNFNDPNSPANT